MKNKFISLNMRKMQIEVLRNISEFNYNEELNEQIPFLGPYQYLNDMSIYYGQYRYGKKNGKGIIQYQNGDIYCGYFKNNKYHGGGRQLFRDGSAMQGIWDQGILNCYQGLIV